MFDDANIIDYIGVTTNSMLSIRGELIMGAGVAKAAKEYNPELPRLFGEHIIKMGVEGGFYGVIFQDNYFAFQTKRNWRDSSCMNDVIESISMLKLICENNPSKTYGLPFPAINHGGLNWRSVIKHLYTLPDNCTVYHLEDLK